MPLSLADKRIIADIAKYRTICLVHRYLYCVKAEPIISDESYDVFERKLKTLVETNPQLEGLATFASDCPTRNIGSSVAEDYPRRIEQLAESLLETHKKRLK